jgi:hypothetical protein
MKTGAEISHPRQRFLSHFPGARGHRCCRVGRRGREAEGITAAASTWGH